MLQVKNVTKYYDDFKALDNVNFTLNDGNLVAIVGVSGGGKTTLMNILGALDSNFEGDVVVNGKSLKQAANKDLETYRKNTIGFVFQNFTLINSLTAFENVELALEISNVSKQERTQKVNELLKSVGLLEHANKKVNVLSGGQKQRVAIARALANDPDIILADEPTGALDIENSLEVMKILKDIAKTKLVIMVTHNQELADEYADVEIQIKDGKIQSITDKHNLNVENTSKNDSKANMPFKTALQLAFRNLKLKKGRTIATAIGMSIGIIGIALALALTTGTRDTITNQVLSIFPANAITVTKVGEETGTSASISYQDYLRIKELAHDAQTAIFIPSSFMGTIASTDKDSADIETFRQNRINNIESEFPATMIPSAMPLNTFDVNLGFGTMPDSNHPYDVVLSLSTAQELIKEDQNVEDLIGQNLYQTFMQFGAGGMQGEGANTQIVTLRVSGISSENTLMSTMYVQEDFYTHLLQDYFDINIEDTSTNMVMITVGDINTIQAYADNLNASQNDFNFAPSAQSVLSTVNTILDLVRNVLIAFSSVSVFIAVIMIAIVIYISVLEKRMEIGIIRAIGGRMKDIRNIFVSESMLVGLLSGIIGVSVAYGITILINNLVTNLLRAQNPHLPAMNVAHLSLSNALFLIGITTLLAVISGLVPSLKAARLDPVDAIRKKL